MFIKLFLNGAVWAGIGFYGTAALFFGWCLWVSNSKYPERLERIRRAWLPIEDEKTQPPRT